MYRDLSSAECALRTPYGRAACRWVVEGTHVALDAEVPPNTSATVVLPGRDGDAIVVGAGPHRWDYDVSEDVAAGWTDQGG